MKTILKRGMPHFLSILLLILPGCTDVLDLLGLQEINSVQSPDKNRIQIQGMIRADHVGIFVGDRNQSDLKTSFMYGKGVLDLSELLKISSRHTHITYRKTENDIQIEDGQFEYIFDNGDILFGTYNGYGSYIKEKPSLSLKLNISGGVGNYKNASGNLEVIINPDPESNSSGLVFKMTGVILLPDNKID